MDNLQIILLAITQGLTEFLPISSSAHLILLPQFLGLPDQGLAFDVAVHLGSLMAVIGYFRHQLRAMATEFIGSLGSGGQATDNSRLVWAVAVATLPIIVAGLLFKSAVETDLRSALVIAATTIGFGLLIYWADVRGKSTYDERSLGWKQALFIGLFQMVAIIPGTSRSGITMAAGLMLGLSREAASRFSFLIAIPTILMSGALVTWDLVQAEDAVIWKDLLLGSALSFVAAYLCIHLFLRFIERIGMLPFVVYRVALGILIIFY